MNTFSVSLDHGQLVFWVGSTKLGTGDVGLKKALAVIEFQSEKEDLKKFFEQAKELLRSALVKRKIEIEAFENGRTRARLLDAHGSVLAAPDILSRFLPELRVRAESPEFAAPSPSPRSPDRT